MSSAVPPPGPTGVLTQWSPQPVAITAVLLLAAGYVWAVRRLPAGTWKRGRSVVFGIGLTALAWTTCGFLQVYAASLYWVWTTQTLLLFLIVPLLVLTGHPLQLARRLSGRIDRVLGSPVLRTLSNPLVGPALVPALSAVLFFGPLPGWAIASAPVGWAVQLAVLGFGALIVLPLVGIDDDAGTLAVGLSLAIGSLELVIDALPGIVLRLHSGLATSYFAHRAVHSWTPSPLSDQRVAGAILWCVAEVIDLPFLLLVYRRWLRADARDAARVDTVLEAERIARRGLPADETAADRDAPWWLTDPSMQHRFRRPR